MLTPARTPTNAYTDDELSAEIVRLQTAIESWARRQELWHDSGFTDFLTHVKGEPGTPAVITILWSEGELRRHIDEDLDTLNGERFYEVLEALGYEYENINGVNFHIYARDERLNAAFVSYFHWQWVCSLITPDVDDVYEEMYAHFRSRPDDLRKLSPRAFEILLARLFQNQGFETELGPGSGDGGVDIRLWQRDPLGDVLTLVQAKRYAPHRKIGQDPVAALYGVMNVEEAPRGIFVTTSAYLPSARFFAGRAGNTIDLKATEDVVKWCSQATNGIIKDKSALISRQSVQALLARLAAGRDPRIVHASSGYTMQLNEFAVILKETKYAALLMSLPTQVVAHDGYMQSGSEVPILGVDAVDRHNASHVFRAMRSVDERGEVSYWNGKNLFHVWSGEPMNFSYVD
jgi:Restriction endonuclease